MISISAEGLDEPIVASHFALGYYRQGTQPGSAPADTTYRYMDVVVHLAINLADDSIVANEIQNAIQYGRSALINDGRLDILLVSIEQAVIARVDKDYSIRRTKATALLEIPCHYTQHPKDRSRKPKTLDDDYDSDASTTGKHKPDAGSSAATFFAMMHLFESGPIQHLKPEAPKEGILPTETGKWY